MKRYILFLSLICSPAFATTIDSNTTTIYGNGTNIFDFGVLGPQTWSYHPDGSTILMGASQNSFQMHFDNIILSKDKNGTVGGHGGDITWKLLPATVGGADVPVFNMGYNTSSPYAFAFETGSSLQQAVTTTFYSYDGAGNEDARIIINSGSASAPVVIPNLQVTGSCTGCGSSGSVNSGTTGELGYYASSGATISGNASTFLDGSGNLQVGHGSLVNPAGLSNLVSIYGASAGFTASNGTQNYSWFINSGYSNSWMLWNGSMYAQTVYPNGHTIIDDVTDDGVNALQVSGTGIRISTAHTPSSSSASCTTGTVNWDSGFIYICVTTNTWKRVTLSTF